MLHPDLPTVPHTFRWMRHAWGHALQCVPLSETALHGWTTRQLALHGNGASGASWEALASSVGRPASAVRQLRQVHGAHVVVAESGSGDGVPEADGIISADPQWVLAVRVADCVPILMADARSGAVAAVHAGWRGTAAGIAGEAVRNLTARAGTDPADIVAAVGPSIGPCCYRVGAELVDAFQAGGHDPRAWFTGRDRLRLDLWAASRDQLLASGIPEERIHLAGLCTACHENWFHSYRRDGAAAGRLVGYIRRRSDVEYVAQHPGRDRD
jgi:polyphenol oxidase